MTLSKEEEIRRGEYAAALLDNDLFKEAFATVEARLLVDWDATSTKDTDLRERLWMQRQMLLRVREHIANVMANGEMVRKNVAQIDQDRKFNLWRKAV